MFTPIHRALGIEPGDLSLNLIEQAIENGVEETTGLDWKRSIYDTRRPGWEDEAAKDIAAMANSGGGWVVFGVAEDNETNTASEIAPIQWNADVQQRILRVAYSRIGPPVVGKPGKPIFIRTTESRSNYLLAVDYAEPIHRFQPVSTELDPLSPLADILPVMNDLARDVINQGGVKFLKVMAEPNDSSSS